MPTPATPTSSTTSIFKFKPGEKIYIPFFQKKGSDSYPGGIEIEQVKVKSSRRISDEEGEFTLVDFEKLNKEEHRNNIETKVREKYFEGKEQFTRKFGALPTEFTPEREQELLDHICDEIAEDSGGQYREELCFRNRKELEDYFKGILNRFFPKTRLKTSPKTSPKTSLKNSK